MIDLANEIWQTLCTNKLRTFLTGFSVAWGIFMLIILVGLAKGVYNSFEARMANQSTNKIQIWGGLTSKPYQGLKEGRWVQLKDKNLKVIEHDNRAHVEEATATVSNSATVSTPYDSRSINYSGVFPSAIKDRGITMKAGRYINENDIRNMRKVIVLDKQTVNAIFKDTTDVVGQTVNLSGISFTVIGWYEHEWRTAIDIPYTTAKALGGFKEEVDQISVNIKNVSNEEEAQELENDLRVTLAKQNRVAPDDNGAFGMWNSFTNYLTTLNAMSILNMTMWVIGLLTLITGIVGVSNIMFVSVKERTHEIGIRRAIGAKPRNILIQIIVESVALTTLFGYIGILLGTIGTEIISNLFSGTEFIKDPTVKISLALQVTAVLIVAGALAGLFPALKALKVRPVEALRTE